MRESRWVAVYHGIGVLVAVGVISFVLFAIVIWFNQHAYEERVTEPPPVFGTEVLPGVFDDGLNTVYIRVDPRASRSQGGQISSLVEKKRVWQQQFPGKRVVAISLEVYSHDLIGLLIHYEQREAVVHQADK